MRILIKSQNIDPAVYNLLNTSPNWRYDALYYISGYIAKQMCGAMKCPECAFALYRSSSDCDRSILLQLICCNRSQPSWPLRHTLSCLFLHPQMSESADNRKVGEKNATSLAECHKIDQRKDCLPCFADNEK